MKKYDKSAVMKKAWEIKRTSKESFSESLKISWKIAKASLSESITFEFVSGEEMTIDMESGIVSGKTYNSRNKIKKDFAGRWDGKNWTVDTSKVIAEMNKFAVVYATVYIVNNSKCTILNKVSVLNKGADKPAKTIIKRWLAPDERGEGYISFIKWNDNTITKSIVG